MQPKNNFFKKIKDLMKYRKVSSCSEYENIYLGKEEGNGLGHRMAKEKKKK